MCDPYITRLQRACHASADDTSNAAYRQFSIWQMYDTRARNVFYIRTVQLYAQPFAARHEHTTTDTQQYCDANCGQLDCESVVIVHA